MGRVRILNRKGNVGKVIANREYTDQKHRGGRPGSTEGTSEGVITNLYPNNVLQQGLAAQVWIQTKCLFDLHQGEGFARTDNQIRKKAKKLKILSKYY